MNPKKLLLLVLILLAAAYGLHILSERAETQLNQLESATGPQADESAAVGLLHGDFRDLRDITIHQSKEVAILRFFQDEQKIWQMLEPMVDLAEPVLIGAMLHVLFELPLEDLEPAWQASSDAELGLAEPRLDVAIRFENSVEEILRVGARHPNGQSHFASVNGQRMMIPRSAADVLLRPSSHWRDHAVLFAAPYVKTVRWAPKDSPGFLLQRNGNFWNILEPIQGKLDPLRVKTLMRSFGSRVSSLPNDHFNAATRRVIEEKGDILEFTTRLDDDIEHVQTLYLYNGVAMDTNRPFLLSLNPEDFRLYQFSADELRSKRLTGFDPTHISSIRILKDSREFTLRRSQTGWIDRQNHRLPPQAQKDLTMLLVYLATFEGTAFAEVPEGTIPRSILLSRAANPTPRGATILRYWPIDAEHSALGVEGSGQQYLTDRSLDKIWDKILKTVE